MIQEADFMVSVTFGTPVMSGYYPHTGEWMVFDVLVISL